MKIIPEDLFGSYMNIGKARIFIRNKGTYYEVEEISPTIHVTVNRETCATLTDIFSIKIKKPDPSIWIDEGFIPIYPKESDNISQDILDEIDNTKIIYAKLYDIIGGISKGFKKEYVNSLIMNCIFIELCDILDLKSLQKIKIKEEFMFKRNLSRNAKKTYGTVPVNESIDTTKEPISTRAADIELKKVMKVISEFVNQDPKIISEMLGLPKELLDYKEARIKNIKDFTDTISELIVPGNKEFAQKLYEKYYKNMFGCKPEDIK